MQIYLKGFILYGFYWQRAFGDRYMAKNPITSQEYQKHDENNIEHRRNILIKG